MDNFVPTYVQFINEALEAEMLLEKKYTYKQRKELVKKGYAMPNKKSGGSFPIVDEADLRNAIRAHSRSKDVNKVKSHIRSRAGALNLSSLIPEAWQPCTHHKAADLSFSCPCRRARSPSPPS